LAAPFVARPFFLLAMSARRSARRSLVATEGFEAVNPEAEDEEGEAALEAVLVGEEDAASAAPPPALMPIVVRDEAEVEPLQATVAALREEVALQAAAIQRHVAAAAAAQAAAEEAFDAEGLAIAERDSLRAQLTSIPIVSQAPLVAELQAAQVGLVNENGLLRVAARDDGWRARAQATRITRLDAELARLVQATVGKHNAAAAARALRAAKEAKHFAAFMAAHMNQINPSVSDGTVALVTPEDGSARLEVGQQGLGARWDVSAKQWIVPAGKDVRPFAFWLYE
jgi:hypothetical protein